MTHLFAQQSEIKKMTVAMPVNSQHEFDYLFKYNSYEYPAATSKKIQHCFISFNGIALNKGLFLETSSVYGYPSNRKNFYKKALEQMYVSCLLRSVPLLKIKRQKIILVTQPWLNFYHWLLESLPRIIQSKPYWGEYKILIQPSAYKLSYVKESLALFPELNLFIPENDTNIWAEEILLPNLRPICENYNPEILISTNNEILNRIKNRNDTPQKLFLIRKKAKKRFISNLGQIEPIISRYGFTLIDLEEYIFEEQVNLTRNATHIIAQHGAGLSHILFLPKGSRVMELHKKIGANLGWSKVYWHLAGALEVPYYSMFCDYENSNDSFFEASISIDPEKLEENLKLFTSNIP